MSKKKKGKLQTLQNSLNLETATVAWEELLTHFARGVVIVVDTELDLVEVASVVATDDSQTLQNWLNKGTVRRASDDDARGWNDRDSLFWCVVTAPWVLIQEKPDT